MDIRIQKVYEAEFALEELRELLRNTSPDHRFSSVQEEKFQRILSRLKKNHNRIRRR